MSKKLSPQALLLRAIREQRGMTQDELAKKSGLSASLVKKIEHGKRRITYEVAQELARVLKTGYRQLYQA